jgi:hypothetical protein
MSEEKKFFQTEIGAIVSRCTHDIVNATALSGGILLRLIRDLKAGQSIDPSLLIEELEIVKNRQEKASDAIDYLYEKVKKIQGF